VAALKKKADDSDLESRRQRAELVGLQRERDRGRAEAEGWKKALSGFQEAVSERDIDIKTLLDQRASLLAANKDAASKANQAILAYNDLASKYEGLVGKYNDLAKRYQADHPPAQEAAAKPTS
jgi:hypothetical protein